MSPVKAVISIASTVAIAAVVAYGVSAPRNVNNAMNQELDALGGQSINQHVAEVRAEVRSEQCERLTRIAQESWDQAVERGTADRDALRLEEMDRQAERFCKP